MKCILTGLTEARVRASFPSIVYRYLGSEAPHLGTGEPGACLSQRGLAAPGENSPKSVVPRARGSPPWNPTFRQNVLIEYQTTAHVILISSD